MAHYEDFNGAYFTIQKIRVELVSRYPDLAGKVEFVIIDNSPLDSKHSELLRGLLGNIPKEEWQYITYLDSNGTSATRNKIFDHARSDYVLVVDCHVLVADDAVPRLIEYYKNNPNTDDLLHGPMWYDHLQSSVTHMDNMWRGQMWGTWANAWVPKDGSAPPMNLTEDGGSLCRMETLASPCVRLGDNVGDLSITHKYAGQSFDDDPFQIYGMGMGLFSARKASWLGFNTDARAFGGEEMYIQEKYRQAGRSVLCLPFLHWLHRFGRVEGITYPISVCDKVRNYILELNELGMPLEPIRKHFVDEIKFPQEEWERLVSDPKNQGCGCGASKKKPTPPPVKVHKYAGKDDVEFYRPLESTQAVFEYLKMIPWDMNQHADTLKAYADKPGVRRITEFSKRPMTTALWLTTNPEKVTSYQLTNSGMIDRTLEVMGYDPEFSLQLGVTSDQVPEIEETDLLLIDSTHTYETLTRELTDFAPKVTSYIILHDTAAYGYAGQDGSNKGLLDALADYLMEHTEWTVVHDVPEQFGLVVISKRQEDKTQLPSLTQKALNFSRAYIEHVADGHRLVSDEVFQERLKICSLCTFRNNDTCGACGCPLNNKAQWASSHCPKLKWGRDHEEE